MGVAKRKKLIAWIFAGALLAFASRVHSQCQTLQWTINKPSPVADDFFGFSVAISGNNLLVGALYDDAGATDAGSAYLFDASTGSLLQTFNNPAPAPANSFGFSVAVSGNNVLVGATNNDNGAADAGGAYLFDATTGALLQTFNNPTPESPDNFGYSVAISGNSVVVGTINDNTGASGAGSAYLFDAITGSLLQTFNNPTPMLNDQFGWSVAVEGSNVLVGAWEDDTGGVDVGSAYLFDATTGALLHTFNNPTPAVGDHFGYSVSLSGNSVLLGAENDDDGALDAGIAYLFDATSGTLLQTFNNPAPDDGDNFGFDVSISGNNVLVGAWWDDTGATDAGSAYLFDATTGALLQTFNNPTPVALDTFGLSVSISGNSILVGTPQNDTGGSSAGIAYVYSCAPTPTPTPTPSPTATPTPSPTSSPTATPTSTPAGLAVICSESNLDGKCRAGNRTLIKACINPPSAWQQIQQVQFEYRPSGGGPWTIIPNANANHPNPDTSHPFFVHWDLTSLANGDYDVRTVATDIFAQTDSNPAFITFTVDTNCGHKENANGSNETEVEAPVEVAQDNNVQCGHHEKHYSLDIEIPVSALNSDTTLIGTCREPSAFAGTYGSRGSIDCFVDLTFQSGQTNFANGKKATLSFEYQDENDDGFVDGFGIAESDLKVFWKNGASWQAQSDSIVDPVLNRISCTTDHFSTYAVLSEPNAARDWSR